MGHLPRQFLTGEADEVGAWYHCQVRQDKYDQVVFRRLRKGEIADDGGGHERPQDIDSGRSLTRGPKADLDELQGVEAPSTALAGGPDGDGTARRRLARAIDLAIVGRLFGAARAALLEVRCSSCARLGSLSGRHLGSTVRCGCYVTVRRVWVRRLGVGFGGQAKGISTWTI